MLKLIIVMIIGVVAGRLMSHRAKLPLPLLLSATVCLLVCLLGYSVGADRQVASALPRLGLKSIVLGAAGTIGAVLATFVLIKSMRR